MLNVKYAKQGVIGGFIALIILCISLYILPRLSLLSVLNNKIAPYLESQLTLATLDNIDESEHRAASNYVISRVSDVVSEALAEHPFVFYKSCQLVESHTNSWLSLVVAEQKGRFLTLTCQADWPAHALYLLLWLAFSSGIWFSLSRLGHQQKRSQNQPPASLQFYLADQRLVIGEKVIDIAPTPFFYYVWYAMQRKQVEGWYMNPRSNQPNMEDGEALAQIMETNGGHGRAIQDLRKNGLRAKVLDQNRSKIKDALISALSGPLAERYLFESQADQKNGRNAYRLLIDPELILFIQN